MQLKCSSPHLDRPIIFLLPYPGTPLFRGTLLPYSSGVARSPGQQPGSVRTPAETAATTIGSMATLICSPRHQALSYDLNGTLRALQPEPFWIISKSCLFPSPLRWGV